MRLTINGELLEISGAQTLSELLRELDIEPGRVAVEINNSIVKKAEYTNVNLNDGDRIEIVNFVGGG